MSPYPPGHETKGMTGKTNDMTIEGLIAKENEKRAVE
jgi:hypothetical protein